MSATRHPLMAHAPTRRAAKPALQPVQRAAINAAPVPAIVHEVLRSPGQPLEASTRAFMEPRFGEDLSQVPAHASPAQPASAISRPDDPAEHAADQTAAKITQAAPSPAAPNYDLSGVRIHTGTQAAEAARAVNARAYTVGQEIVFGAGQYAPGTAEGRQLLAHELSHVVRSPAAAMVQRKPADTAAQSAVAADDFIRAETYLTDFYDNEDKIVADVYVNYANAVHQFGHYAQVKPAEGAEPPMATIKAVLKIIPEGEGILEVIELVEKITPVAKEVAGLAQKAGQAGADEGSKEKADPEQTKADTLTKTLGQFTSEREALSRQRQSDRIYLEAMRTDPKSPGHLLPTMQARLGPIKPYRADVITRFGLEYELQMYKDFYVQNAWINHEPPSLFGNPYTQYAIMGVPEPAQKQILRLFKLLGHTASVSIDTHFAEFSGKPEYAQVVKILLDWGVKLYWLRGYASDKPEVLHSGNDLQQPYRGERFKEVK